MESDRIEVKGRLVKGLLIGGVLILLTGIGLYWVYFEYRANPPTLVMAILVMAVGLLFIYLTISVYLSCLVIDDTGIVKTNLFRGYVQIKWKDIANVAEKPGIEHGIVKLEIVPVKGRKIEIYSNWVEDYNLLLNMVASRVAVDISRSRFRDSDDPLQAASKRIPPTGKSTSGDPDRSTHANLRLRVSGVQILYLLGLAAMTFFLVWRAINR